MRPAGSGSCRCLLRGIQPDVDNACSIYRQLPFLPLQVQVCAAGALLNIQSPLLESMQAQTSTSVKTSVRLMTSILTLSIIERCIAAAEGNYARA